MNSLSREHLQELCRACLNKIFERSALGTIGSNATESDRTVTPELKKLLLLFTSLDSFSEDRTNYPQRLCKQCYDKLKDFEEFRRMIVESEQKIELVLKTPEPCTESDTEKALNTTSNSQPNCSDDCPSDGDDDNDNNNKLLVPELVTEWDPNTVKTEPIDLAASTAESSSKKGNDFQVKNEIDSDCEQDENNAMNEMHIDESNEPTPEEIALRNAFRNELFFSASFQAYKSGSLTTHRRRERGKKAIKCPRCNKYVYKKVYLDAHIRSKHEGHEKPFLCSVCKKSFTRYKQLHVHMQTTHAVAIKHVCGIAGCTATFRMNQTLETHRRVVHSEEVKPPLIAQHQQQLVEEWEMDHFCYQCEKRYSSRRALSEHMKRHSNIKEHVCQVCGAAKVTRTELLTHMRTHDSNLEKFKCTLCPQEFNHKNAISRHVRVVHQGERRFICTLCPRRFGTRHAQMSHERIHTGERPFKCNTCPKGFAQIEGLKSHMKNHDKSLRKHVCKHCSQRFITRKNLVHHEQRHLGDKPHICVSCNRGFFSREELDKHNKSHEDEVKTKEPVKSPEDEVKTKEPVKSPEDEVKTKEPVKSPEDEVKTKEPVKSHEDEVKTKEPVRRRSKRRTNQMKDADKSNDRMSQDEAAVKKKRKTEENH